MEQETRSFMIDAEPERAVAFWQCYMKQTRYALSAAKEHELCTGLQFGCRSDAFLRALQATSMLASRVAALIDFARTQQYDCAGSTEVTDMEAEAMQLSVERYRTAQEIAQKSMPATHHGHSSSPSRLSGPDPPFDPHTFDLQSCGTQSMD